MKYALLALAATTVAMLADPVSKWCNSRFESRPATRPAGDEFTDLETEIHALGYVEPGSGVRELSFEIGGVIGRCDCEIGDKVAKGDVLASLRDEQLQASLQVALADLAVADARRNKLLAGAHADRIEMARHRRSALAFQVEYLTAELARNERVLASNSLTDSDFQDMANQLRVARAESMRAAAQLRHLECQVTDEDRLLADRTVELAKAKVESARALLDQTLLKAPHDGIVLDILRREGESVDQLARQPIILFGRRGPFRVRVEVDESHVLRLRPGMPAVVTGRNLRGERHRGRVRLVKPHMGPKTVFNGDCRQRQSLDVVEVLVDLDADFTAPVGLMVDVLIDVGLQ